jgi:hypothetical protein
MRCEWVRAASKPRMLSEFASGVKQEGVRRAEVWRERGRAQLIWRDETELMVLG